MGNKSICFGTLALGSLYRAHARMLAIDLENFSPGVDFLVLTDRPNDFSAHQNVHARRFKADALATPYHDKRFVLSEGLRHYDASIFLDADVRVLEPVVEDLYESLAPGINTYYCGHWKTWETRRKGAEREKSLVREAAKLVGVDLSDCTFMLEQVIGIKKDNDRHQVFLDTWDTLAHHFQLKGLHGGVGHSLGLAASVANFQICENWFLGKELFKDLWVKNQLQVSTTRNQICFQQHRLLTSIANNSLESKLQGIRRRLRRIYHHCSPISSWKTLD